MTFSFKLSHRLAQGWGMVLTAATLAACAGERSITDPSQPSAPVSSIVISPSTVNLTVNGTAQVAAALKDASGATLTGRTVTWTSDATTVVTVSTTGTTGVLQASSAGTAKITATSEGRSATATVTVTAPTIAGSPSCLTQAASIMTLSGTPSPYNNGSMAPNTGINARTASWIGTIDIAVRYEGGSSVCWSGGSIRGLFPDGTSWDAYHDAYSMVIRRSPGTVIEGVRIHNYGDGPNFDATGSDNWTVRGNHMSYMHDDCVANDFGNTGLVDDNLMDGCYMGYSSRAYDGFTGDNRTKVVTFRGNLIRLQQMPTGYAAPGHGRFWKLDRNGIDPRLALHDNVFRVDALPNCCGGIFLIPPTAYLKECSNNIIVWLGAGEFPEPVPSCFTVTRDKSVWDNAVAAWKARHPNVAS